MSGGATVAEMVARSGSESRPIFFLDFDDVICLNSPYGGYDVFAPERPPDLWERLFHKPAVETLLRAIEEHDALVVLTTSWLRLMAREGFEDLFRLAGLERVLAALHPRAWETPQNRNETRLQSIERWLAEYHRGEPFVVLDDALSGVGLVGSKLHQRGQVVLCEVNVGLLPHHLETIRQALRSSI